MKGIYNWLGRYIHSKFGLLILGTLVFIEGFFFVPLSTILAFYCLQNRSKSFLYAFIATVMSAFGALAGYYLGTLLWQAAGSNIINYLISPEKFNVLVNQLKHYQAWTIFFVALMPMPFKALTLTAGFCKLPLIPFIFFSLIARGLRFFAIALGIVLWGQRLEYYLNKYFYFLIIIAILFFVVMWFIIH